MKKRCFLKAPAKLNLHLQVGKRREDGFHDINSLFIMVDLFDEINAGSLKTGNDCRIKGNFNCKVEENLIYKAWVEFCRAAGESFGVEFTVRKIIPSGAGLGGGSSDAAAALRIMNMLAGTGWDNRRLAEIGGRIGSDVPFFFSSPAALIGGRGERVIPVDPVRLEFVLVSPGIDIATGDAYSWIDESNCTRKPFLSEDSILELFRGDAACYNGFQNDFYGVLKTRYKIFEQITSELKIQGSVYANVTGSGSAVFGVFSEQETAVKAAKNLKNRYKFVQKIKSLDIIPYAILE